MAERQKLELQINQPTPIELLFDEPVTGENKYGSYYMYAVKSNGTEYAFFAPKEVHEELQHLGKGDKAVVTKLAAQRGKKLVTRFVVETANGKSRSNGNGADTQPSAKTETAVAKEDPYYDIMLKSYEDALQIQDELNGMVDVTRIAITLFIARSRLSFNGNGH